MDILLKILAGLGLIMGFALLMAFPTMLLWNWLMPDLFGLVEIDFLQALGINTFSGIMLNSSKK